MDEAGVRLLELGGAGAGLTVLASRREHAGASDDPWFDVAITVDALPFSGTVDTIFTLADLQDWADSLRSQSGFPRRVVLGGGRAAELLLDVEQQVGGEDGALAVEVSVTPSGDDPFPLLRYLIFDATPFWDEASARIDALT